MNNQLMGMNSYILNGMAATELKVKPSRLSVDKFCGDKYVVNVLVKWYSIPFYLIFRPTMLSRVNLLISKVKDKNPTARVKVVFGLYSNNWSK